MRPISRVLTKDLYAGTEAWELWPDYEKVVEMIQWNQLESQSTRIGKLGNLSLLYKFLNWIRNK